MDYRKQFVVEPGSRFRLSSVESGYTGKHMSRETVDMEIRAHIAQMDAMQYLLFADGHQSLLVVLQGLDASGKDGVIRHLFTGMNPQGTAVASFKQPTQLESEHDFLWRVHPHVPRRGDVVIFNRSHYEDVLVARVHKLVAKPVWRARFSMINDFEELLFDNGTHILKFYLHISPEEQLRRFEKRLADPMRQWKISESDYEERALWPCYLEAYEDAFTHTSTKRAPWYIIPSDHKWFRNLAISFIVAQTMGDLGLKTPPVRIDLAEIRRRYHAAAETQSSGVQREQ